MVGGRRSERTRGPPLASATALASRGMSEALPAGPTVDRTRLLHTPSPDDLEHAARELASVAEAVDGVLAELGPGDDRQDAADADGATGLTPARLRRQATAIRDLARDGADAFAAAIERLAGAAAESERVVARAEVEVARLWQRVSADVSSRRAATEAFVARAQERAEDDAARILAEAHARADELVAGTEHLVAAWLDEEPAQAVAVPIAVPEPTAAPLAISDPPARKTGKERRRGRLCDLFRRRSRRGTAMPAGR